MTEHRVPDDRASVLALTNPTETAEASDVPVTMGPQRTPVTMGPQAAPNPGALRAPERRPSSVPPGDPSRDLAGALHEVSNALTVVVGWIERAQQAVGSPEAVARALHIAASRASEARGIVRHAIGAEPPRDQEQEHEEEAVAAIVADALTGLDPELRRRAIEGHGTVDDALAARRVPHASSVRQILTNLLLNAAAMSPSGSIVRLDASPAGERVVFSVTDAGPGIPHERRSSLFHAGISTRAGGAGIGLRHAAALATSHGGELTLANSDRGARFELSWPLVPATQPARRAPERDGVDRNRVEREGIDHDAIDRRHTAPARALPLEGMRVLLVEDDEAVVDLLDTALTARGADVVSVRHRRDLDGALESGPFDAALFDISPIQDDVRGAVERARVASGDLRVVMISGTAAALPAMPDGWISAWVRKPFEVGEIVHTIAPAPRRA